MNVDLFISAVRKYLVGYLTEIKQYVSILSVVDTYLYKTDKYRLKKSKETRKK